MRARCLPVEVTVVQWFETYGPCFGVEYDPKRQGFYLSTGRENMTVKDGDWIIMGDDGTRWVCERSKFDKLYETIGGKR